MRTAAALLLAGLLSACSTLPAEVKIPVSVPCVPRETPEPPAISSGAELKAMGDEELVLTIAAERLELAGYAAEAGAVIKACR